MEKSEKLKLWLPEDSDPLEVSQLSENFETLDAEIAKIVSGSGPEAAAKVGDTISTLRTDLGDNWLLCNGEGFDPKEYPQLAEIFDTSIPFEACYASERPHGDSPGRINPRSLGLGSSKRYFFATRSVSGSTSTTYYTYVIDCESLRVNQIAKSSSTPDSWSAYEPETDTMLYCSASYIYIRTVDDDLNVTGTRIGSSSGFTSGQITALCKDNRIYIIPTYRSASSGTALSSLKLGSFDPDGTNFAASAFDISNYVLDGWTTPAKDNFAVGSARVDGKFVILTKNKTFDSLTDVVAGTTYTPCALLVVDADDIEHPERTVPVTFTISKNTKAKITGCAFNINTGEALFQLSFGTGSSSVTKTVHRVLAIKHLDDIPDAVHFDIDADLEEHGVNVGSHCIVKNRAGYLYDVRSEAGATTVVSVHLAQDLDDVSTSKVISGIPITSFAVFPLGGSAIPVEYKAGSLPGVVAAYGSEDVIFPCVETDGGYAMFKYPNYPLPYLPGDAYTYIKAKEAADNGNQQADASPD